MALKRSDEFLSDFLSDSNEDNTEPLVQPDTSSTEPKHNPFSKLEEKMNLLAGSTKLPNKKEIKEIKTEILDAIDETKDIIKSDEDSFEDKNFIQEKLKCAIIKVESQMDNLENSLLIGAEPRMWETYAILAKTLFSGLRDLMELQKMVQMTLISQNQAQIATDNKHGVVLEEKVTRKISASNFQDLLDEIG